MEAPPPASVAHHRKHNVVFAPEEFMLTTGAGPTNYFGSSNTMRTDVGAAWDVRATFGARSILALEAAYMGATNTVEQNSVHNGNINSNGIDSDLRLQLPFRVQPYIFGGVGWNYMTLNNSTISATQKTTDNQVTVPAGAGFSAYLTRHLDFDLRGTYRYIGANELQTPGGGSTVSHQWLAQARLGYAF
jgi:opacity protein-like surface antigen